MPSAAEELRLKEYDLARAAERLAARLYGPRPGDADALARDLARTQAELRRTADERRKLEEGAGAGVIVGAAGTRRQLMGRATTQIEATATLRMPHVPTAIVHLLDEATPLVTFVVENARTKALRVRLTSRVEGYSAAAVETREIAPGERATVNQLPTFFPDRLRRVTELTRATLTLTVEDLDGRGAGGVEQQRTLPLWLLARTSAYLAMEDPAGGWIDLTRYLGAWVTPDAPAVMELLRAAAAKHPDGQMVGYQVDAAGVEAQVKAVFEALAEADLTYVNSVLSFGVAAGYAAQRIRLPRESLRTRSANCVDGTVLMASVLEAATLRPAIVLVPGHAFLAWERQENGGEWDYVETTMIARRDFAAAVASGRQTAARYEGMTRGAGEPAAFQRLAVHELRARDGIFPME